MIRLAILVLLAIGTGLVSLLWFSGPTAEQAQNNVDVADRCLQYLETPWVLTTIFVVYTVVLVLTHIGGTSVKKPSKPSTISVFPKKRPSYGPVSVPMTSSHDWAKQKQHDGHDDSVTSPYEAHDIAMASSAAERTPVSYDPLKHPSY